MSLKVGLTLAIWLERNEWIVLLNNHSNLARISTYTSTHLKSTKDQEEIYFAWLLLFESVRITHYEIISPAYKWNWGPLFWFTDPFVRGRLLDLYISDALFIDTLLQPRSLLLCICNLLPDNHLWAFCLQSLLELKSGACWCNWLTVTLGIFLCSLCEPLKFL